MMTVVAASHTESPPTRLGSLAIRILALEAAKVAAKEEKEGAREVKGVAKATLAAMTEDRAAHRIVTRAVSARVVTVGKVGISVLLVLRSGEFHGIMRNWCPSPRISMWSTLLSPL
mmetsp:Transcript_69627/g.159987  ORF Transcript_69627/g.159987 Transcript_69627/m.159987 type:complete len:116 (-) Transcript_69627:1409-1756(-)